MRTGFCNRRAFLRRVVGCGTGAAGLGLTGSPPAFSAGPSEVREHRLTVVSGKPRERGRQYGRHFKDGIALWLHDITKARQRDTPDRLLRFAAACGKEIKAFSPGVFDELEGIAEGTGRRLEEILLLACHEELWQGGALPPAEHCHVVAVGPPDTTGEAYVGQTYDFFGPTVSHLVHWKRAEEPSVLAYGFPGLWVSVGLNSAGLAVGATSVLSPGGNARGPRVGVPYYAWAAHTLAQDSLKAALDESRRAKHAGWWTAVLADAKGNLANVEVRLGEVVVGEGRGHIARHQFGSRRMTATPEGREVRLAGQAPRIARSIAEAKGRVEDRFLMDLMAQVGGTHDLMVFNASRGVVHIRRTQAKADLPWQRFAVREG